MPQTDQELRQHRSDCTATAFEEPCFPESGSWDHWNWPPLKVLREARETGLERLGELPPWCRIHERACELAGEEQLRSGHVQDTNPV